jgi:hypothetical protein
VKTPGIRILLAFSILLTAHGCSRNEGPSDNTAPSSQSAAANLFNPAKGTAGIIGQIKFEGPVPASAQVKMNADPVCMSLHKQPVESDETIIIDGKLVNTFVYVKEGLEKYTFTPPAEPATLSQEGCRYVPHVGGIMVNQGLRVVNNDPTLHNVHCLAEKNPQFNLGQPVKGMESVRKFTNPEIMVKFRCDVHKWMTSYLGVLPHPYYSVTGQDGKFALKGLPPGDYVIEAWHEKYGVKSIKVTLGDKEVKEISLAFSAS